MDKRAREPPQGLCGKKTSELIILKIKNKKKQK
jgi:hypothetical protein